MKPRTTLRHFLFAAASALVSLPNASATEYWWNQNSTTAGWGAGGVWNTTNAFFSNTNSDTASAAAATTTTSDILNIGTSAVGFTGGTIGLGGTTQSIGTILTGSANTTADVIINNGTLTFAASGTITNNSSRVLIIDAAIGSAGASTRLDLNANGGDIAMSGAFNTYTGITYINSGTVFTNNVASLGASGTDANRTVVASGARLVFNNDPRTYTERFEIAGAGVGGASGALVNSANRRTTLNGQVTLSGNATTYSDSTTNTTALTFGGGIVLGANALTFNSVNVGSVQTVQTTAISGTNGSVVKTGSGILNLNVASSYTGGTTLNAGTINIGAAISGSNSAIGSTSGQLTVNGGTLNMAGNNVTVGNLTGSGGVISGTSGTRTLTIGEGNAGGGNYQGQINNGAGGTTALIKTGSGTITLSGANGYSGGTSVTQGTLLINNTTGSGTGSAAVNVGVNGTLGGSGIISGATTIAGNLNPGNSPGLLSFGSSLTLLESAVTTMEIDGLVRGTEYDAVNTSGLFTYAGDLILDLGTTFDSNQTFNLFDFGSMTGSFENMSLTGLYTGSLINDGFGVWSLTSDANGFTNTWVFNQANGELGLTVAVIPEPKAALLGAVGMLLLFRRRR